MEPRLGLSGGIRALIRALALWRCLATEIKGLLLALASLVAAVVTITRHWL